MIQHNCRISVTVHLPFNDLALCSACYMHHISSKTDESAKSFADSGMSDQLRCMQCCAGVKRFTDLDGQSPC